MLWEVLRSNRLIALLTPASADECVLAYESLHPLGVVLEIACRSEAALPGMAALRTRHPDALFLAGTVLTHRQAERVIEVGAAGIVSPDFLPPVVEACVRSDVMCIPGGVGDIGKQLAAKAEAYGCDVDELRVRYPYQWVYKLFPALASPALLEMASAWKTVFPELTIVYSGGLTAENAGQVLRRDPDAILCGSALARHVKDRDLAAREVGRWASVVREALSPAAEPRPTSPTAPATRPPTVVTFGELLLRLSPPHGLRLGQATRLDAAFGGAEANVAVALARWGLEARFVTALPKHALGDAALAALRAHGVDTRHVLRLGDRLGLYYLEHGAAQRPAQVIYDRAGSAVNAVQPGQVDWAGVFQGSDWFHCSGITPALSGNAAEVASEALHVARRSGLTVSFDLNYRAKLWSGAQACETLTPLMSCVDILIGNEEDAANVFGIGPAVDLGRPNGLDPQSYRDVTRQLVERLRLRMAAITLRASTSASENAWSACLYDGKGFHVSRRYAIPVVDRVGAGDAFAAGLIYGQLTGKSAADTLEFAVAASCWKHTIVGDFNLSTVQEVESIAHGNVTGRVER
jgi:2-dehydro-3-deoxygluconokinase